MNKKRYAIVGISGRSKVYTTRILNEYNDVAEIVALLDSNKARITDFNETNGLSLPGYSETEFDKMAAEIKPDAVIISTTDGTHHTFIVAAMENNIDAICEKPMATHADQVRGILAAEKKSSANTVITFNYRYAPIHTKIKKLVLDGAVGRPTQVDFNYYLDTLHGASYFKRWNRYEEQSGSLLVTKACHHFDLVNWMIDQQPVEVFAYGALNYYGPSGPENPSKIDGRRCSTCTEKCQYYLRHSTGDGEQDEHLININNPGKNETFAKADGYYADRCIFDSNIDTWDTFSLSVLYDGGTMMSYSLNASLPYEGYRLTINGTKGRIESDSTHTRLPSQGPSSHTLRYFPLFGDMQTIETPHKEGGHGGADPIIMDEIFTGQNKSDRTKRFAGTHAGAMSALLGIAARESLKSGKKVRIADLLQD
jgi:predicted dehydrogenase